MRLPDLALGSYEAAAVAGLHYTKPRDYVRRGWLVATTFTCGRPGKKNQVYSLHDCDKNYLEYIAQKVRCGHPRTNLDERPAALERLAKEPQILYADACGVQDALAILNLESTSQITRMIAAGELIGRKAWNPRLRRNGGMLWIISRRSVEERRKRIIALENAGTKTGIRKFIAKTA